MFIVYLHHLVVIAAKQQMTVDHNLWGVGTRLTGEALLFLRARDDADAYPTIVSTHRRDKAPPVGLWVVHFDCREVVAAIVASNGVQHPHVGDKCHAGTGYVH